MISRSTEPAFESATARERAEKALTSPWFRPDAVSVLARDLLTALDENERLRRLLLESLGWMEGVEPKPAPPFLAEIRNALEEEKG